MVKIASPSPENLVRAKPLHYTLNQGESMCRIFRPHPEYYPKPLTFRYWGPCARFDHHCGGLCFPCHQELEIKEDYDPHRGILYTAFEFSCCLVEVFSDTLPLIEITDHQVVLLTAKRDLMLLDIRDQGAMRAGANEASLAKTDKRSITQAWSRCFYEEKAIYSEIDGIIYRSAHNNQDSIVFYERAKDYLTYDPDADVLSLKDKQLRGLIYKAAEENNLIVKFTAE